MTYPSRECLGPLSIIATVSAVLEGGGCTNETSSGDSSMSDDEVEEDEESDAQMEVSSLCEKWKSLPKM